MAYPDVSVDEHIELTNPQTDTLFADSQAIPRYKSFRTAALAPTKRATTFGAALLVGLTTGGIVAFISRNGSAAAIAAVVVFSVSFVLLLAVRGSK